MTTTSGHAIAIMARMGYASRGIVYLLVGGLAAVAALGQGGQTTGSRGALERLLTAPLGHALLVALALGLVGYALWRCVQAIKDTDDHGLSPKGLTIRSSLLVSAATHTLLAIFAITLTISIGGESSGGSSQSLAGWLMQQPFGRWMVAAVGAVMFGAGLAHAKKGITAQFDQHFDMPSAVQLWAYPICRFGLAVRGLVFLITGTLFVIAAYQIDPDEAGGMAEMFDTFRSSPFGTWLIGFVAVGLVAFGTYSLLEAVYRRVEPDS